LKPLPVPDARSAGYWEAASRHTLAIQRCLHCARYAHPPAVVCQGCRSAEPRFEFQPVSGAARLRTWTVIRQAFIPAFEADVPWVIAVGELREQAGLLLTARLLDGTKASPRIGAPLRVVFEDVTPGCTLPQFLLDERQA
jgi:uncharacterized OB-fold protein